MRGRLLSRPVILATAPPNTLPWRPTTLSQTVKAGTFAEALKDVDPGAEAPGWISEPVLKYISTRRPDKEVGLVMNASQPTVSDCVGGYRVDDVGEEGIVPVPR